MPGMAVDEMQHAVMRAAEAEFGERLVGIADEVAIGEEQQFDQVPDRLAGGRAGAASGVGGREMRRACGGSSYLGQPY